MSYVSIRPNPAPGRRVRSVARNCLVESSARNGCAVGESLARRPGAQQFEVEVSPVVGSAGPAPARGGVVVTIVGPTSGAPADDEAR